jgi:hypothetical protein
MPLTQLPGLWLCGFQELSLVKRARNMLCLWRKLVYGHDDGDVLYGNNEIHKIHDWAP